METCVEIALKCGYIKDKNIIISPETANHMKPSEVCLILLIISYALALSTPLEVHRFSSVIGGVLSNTVVVLIILPIAVLLT